MANRTDGVSPLFREFAAYTIRHTAIDFHPHMIADLLDTIEVQQECGCGPWTAEELDAVESESDDFEDDDPLSDFVYVPPGEVCREVPVDSVLADSRSYLSHLAGTARLTMTWSGERPDWPHEPFAHGDS